MALLVPLGACSPEDRASQDDPPVILGAAFTTLDRVDVYDQQGGFVSTIDADMDLQDLLGRGQYLMDFISADGTHAFMEDGRMAFAPMMGGGLPVDGPIILDGFEAPLWSVEVHPSLEADARLAIRQREMDKTLLPWKPYFETWGGAPNDDWIEFRQEDPSDFERGSNFTMTATGLYASQRLRVTWEASFAMDGKFTLSAVDPDTCNTATKCWTHTTTTPTGSYYAIWNLDGDAKGGYIDYDATAFSTAVSSLYLVGGLYLASCFDDPGKYGGTCGLTVTGTKTNGVANAKDYTCQSTTGTCTVGVTKPRGGECKFFQNLLLYRSGSYNAGVWKVLPGDNLIVAPAYVKETSASMNVGDVLRDTSPIHSTLIVAFDPVSATALVVDSNWVGTTSVPVVYNEYIGAHVMGFTGSGSSNLSNYFKLDCVYSGSC